MLEFALTLEIWRPGVVNLCNCLQLCVEIELSPRFWKPWVARIQARAQFESDFCDSYEDIDAPRGWSLGRVLEGLDAPAGFWVKRQTNRAEVF